MYTIRSTHVVHVYNDILPESSIFCCSNHQTQSPIEAQVVNLIGEISSGNTSCIFTRELNKKPQQYSTDYLYKVLMVHAMTVKIVDSGLHFYFLFSLYFIFPFSFSFIFYFQNNSGQGLSVMLSQVDGQVTRLITELRRMEQKVLE